MTDAPLALTLKDAAERYGFTVATLRAEHQRGRLALYRVGKRLYTTPADIREMVHLCREEPKAPVSIATRRAVNTSSETDRASYDSAEQALLKLRSISRRTSPASINRIPARGR
jgi:DNA-binding transcriptional MerR regulator